MVAGAFHQPRIAQGRLVIKFAITSYGRGQVRRLWLTNERFCSGNLASVVARQYKQVKTSGGI